MESRGKSDTFELPHGIIGTQHGNPKFHFNPIAKNWGFKDSILTFSGLFANASANTFDQL